MSFRRGWKIGGLALASIVTFGLYWLFTPRPVLVETATAMSATYQDTIEEDGRARVRDRYMVSAPLSGRVQRLTLKPGDGVRTGQRLAVITPPVSPLLDARVRRELEAQVGAAEAGLEEAEALHEQAKVLLTQASADLDRTRQLALRKVASAAQLEKQEAMVRSADLQAAAAERRSHAASHILEQARAALRSAGNPDPIEDFPVLSPIDGRVLRVEQESETIVSQATPLVELGDPADLEIAVDVLTTDAARVRPGDKVTIARWGGPTDLQGVVRRVEPSGFTKISALGVEEQRVWVIVDMVSPRQAWTSLGDGYRVEARIVVDETDQAIVIPTGALFRRDGQWNVFVVDAGRAHLRQVLVSHISERAAAIAKGVRPGETVVSYPPAVLTDGSRVTLQ